MRHLHVRWFHDSLEDPVELYSEIDEDGWEVRKVEVFRDGRLGFADAMDSTESTRLGLDVVPPIDEIGLDPQFRVKTIDREEFECLWSAARLVFRPE